MFENGFCDGWRVSKAFGRPHFPERLRTDTRRTKAAHTVEKLMAIRPALTTKERTDHEPTVAIEVREYYDGAGGSAVLCGIAPVLHTILIRVVEDRPANRRQHRQRSAMSPDRVCVVAVTCCATLLQPT
jgi:hypothetical protein